MIVTGMREQDGREKTEDRAKEAAEHGMPWEGAGGFHRRSGANADVEQWACQAGIEKNHALRRGHGFQTKNN
jgi:hypothetical protein